VTAELARSEPLRSGKVCPNCAAEGHDLDAAFCKLCGVRL
jgi:voltage-gated potassium channel